VSLSRHPALAAPRLAILFSGHLMDRPGRSPPRFPPALEHAAARQIALELDQLQAGPDDLALCQAAAGGDLLFLEACQARSVRVKVVLPFDEARFLRESVLPSAHGAHWARRYRAVRARLAEAPQTLPADPGSDPFERCNESLLAAAMHWGADKARFICLWNGGAPGGPGGTAHLVERARQEGLVARVIDTRLLPGA